MDESLSLLCPYCNSGNTVWRGYRYLKSGKKRRRLCNDCKRTFTPDDGFLRMRYPKHIISMCVDLYRKGLSLQKVHDFMLAHYELDIPRKTIWEWVTKYGNILSKGADLVQPTIKGTIHEDEIFVKVKGKNMPSWGAVDRETKYKFSGKVTKTRTQDGANHLARKLRYGCKNLPELIVSDKLAQYAKAYRKFFWRMRSKVHMNHGVPIACKKYGLERNNNPIERENGRIRARTKTMRGGFRNKESARKIIHLMDVLHNFADVHPALNGRTPAEAAHLNFDFGGKKIQQIFFSTGSERLYP